MASRRCLCILANALWTAGNLRHWLRWQRARRDARWAQERILRSFLRRNAGSAYGRSHGYAGIRSVEEFQARVPVSTYEDLEPWIRRILHGERNVLTAEPVLFVEKTSGSSGRAKYIPYTVSLLRELRRAVGAWMFDLFARRPALLLGPQYWSITPARVREVTPGGLRVGLDDDTQYLGPVSAWLLRAALAVPGALARTSDMQEWKARTLKHLAARRDLRFVSVWSPSLLALLAKGLPAGVRPAEVWPELRTVSCWTAGPSALVLPELRGFFPGVEVQGKGLLATEGVVSFPASGFPAPVPAITSHFLEFLEDDGTPRLAGQLERGGRYTVVITTGGGLARYALGDVVEAVAPDSIEFAGRAGAMSDLCGEKLGEEFVGRIVQDAARRFGLWGLAMVAPEWSSPPRYVFLCGSPRAGEAAAFIESRLRAAFHYDQARRLGQLGPVSAARVEDGEARYLRACVQLGQRAGDVKPAYLRCELGWREILAGDRDRDGAPAAPLAEAASLQPAAAS